MEYPKLIETNVRAYLSNTLQKCHETKYNFQSWIFNISGFLLFGAVLATILFFCRKRKLTSYEQSEKQRREQEYILSKIRQYQSFKSPITNLPSTFGEGAPTVPPPTPSLIRIR